MTTAHRLAATAAVIGGTAWIADTASITLRDHQGGAADTLMWLVGLAAVAVAAVAAGVAVAGRHAVPVRIGAGIAGFVLAAVLIMAFQGGVNALVDAVYDGSNVGVQEELGIMAFAAVLVVAGALALGRPAPRVARA